MKRFSICDEIYISKCAATYETLKRSHCKVVLVRFRENIRKGQVAYRPPPSHFLIYTMAVATTTIIGSTINFVARDQYNFHFNAPPTPPPQPPFEDSYGKFNDFLECISSNCDLKIPSVDY